MPTVGGMPLIAVDFQGADATIWRPGPGRSIMDGPRNGNWCGGNWSGGQVPSLNGGKDGTAKPMDSMDSCCMQHDFCYEKCDKVPASQHKACLKKCDATLVGCLQSLNKDCTKWAQPPRKGTESDSESYRDNAIRLFR
jgi:hypothetical protein